MPFVCAQGVLCLVIFSRRIERPSIVEETALLFCLLISNTLTTPKPDPKIPVTGCHRFTCRVSRQHPIKIVMIPSHAILPFSQELHCGLRISQLSTMPDPIRDLGVLTCRRAAMSNAHHSSHLGIPQPLILSLNHDTAPASYSHSARFSSFRT